MRISVTLFMVVLVVAHATLTSAQPAGEVAAAHPSGPDGDASRSARAALDIDRERTALPSWFAPGPSLDAALRPFGFSYADRQADVIQLLEP